MTKLNEKWLVCFELCFECVVVQHLNNAKATLLFIRFNMFILCSGKNGSPQGESRSLPNMTLQMSQDEISEVRVVYLCSSIEQYCAISSVSYNIVVQIVFNLILVQKSIQTKHGSAIKKIDFFF